MREYAVRRGWTIGMQVREVGSGAARREAREKLLQAARRRESTFRAGLALDRWGSGSFPDRGRLDLTTQAGRAMAGLLAIFAEFEREILRERTKRAGPLPVENRRRLGRPPSAAAHARRSPETLSRGLSK